MVFDVCYAVDVESGGLHNIKYYEAIFCEEDIRCSLRRTDNGDIYLANEYIIIDLLYTIYKKINPGCKVVCSIISIDYVNSNENTILFSKEITDTKFISDHSNIFDGMKKEN